MKTKYTKFVVGIAMLAVTAYLLFNISVPFHNAVIVLMGGGGGGTSMNVDFDPMSTPTLVP